MPLSMAPLLMHSQQVPTEVRDAIRAAYEAPPQHRSATLEAAARVLHDVTGLECSDVRELVGLPDDGDCADGSGAPTAIPGEGHGGSG
jgi:hypothetical protein